MPVSKKFHEGWTGMMPIHPGVVVGKSMSFTDGAIWKWKQALSVRAASQC